MGRGEGGEGRGVCWLFWVGLAGWLAGQIDSGHGIGF